MKHIITMGMYIDNLSDEKLDNILMAQDMSDGVWWDYHRQCGCLVGTAEGAPGVDDNVVFWERRYMVMLQRCRHTACAHLTWHRLDAPYRYPDAVDRFGKPRIMRAIKKRAARVLAQRYSVAEYVAELEASLL